MREPPRLLLATTTWWPSLAVLASAFERAGFDVVMLCPKGHVAWRARRFASRALDGRKPAASVAAAIEAVAPALVVPGDERMLRLLRDLHAERPAWRPLIERSIGAPGSHPFLLARVPLLHAAAEAGFTTPRTEALRSQRELDDWMGRVRPPWVLKVDGAWGGEGVRIAADPDAATQAFRALRSRTSLGSALRRRFVNGDPFPWHDRRRADPPSVSVQAFVPGRAGNCAVYARDGRVLGATVVEAMKTSGDRGPSLLVRVVDRPDIVGSVGRLVARVGLSGFLGFDFVFDPSGAANLIEMNPRVTMPCRMAGPFGQAPVAAAAAALGAEARHGRIGACREVFASFPLAWLADPFDPALATCAEDVPWHEPDLLGAALRPLWPETGALAALPARMRALRAWTSGRPCTDHRWRSRAWWSAHGGLDPRDCDDVSAGAVRVLPRAGAVEAGLRQA